MSTRSGKRLHTSPESELKPQEMKTKRKTRSQKQKENCIDAEVSKKKHYVLRYPSEEEISNDASSQMALRNRKSRRITLKEVSNNEIDIPKSIKTNRRKKAVENDIVPNLSQKASKKSKIKKIVNTTAQHNEAPITAENKVMKKKISSGSVVIEDLNDRNKSANNNNISVDSFHSAATSNVDSPEEIVLEKHNLKTSVKNNNNMIDCKRNINKKDIKKKKRQVRSTLCKRDAKQSIISKCVAQENSYNAEDSSHNGSAFNKLFDINRRSRSSYKNSTFTDISTDNTQNALTLIDDKTDKKKSSLVDCDNIVYSNKNNSSQSISNDNTLLEMIHKLGKKQNENDLNYEFQTVNTTFEKQTIDINMTSDNYENNICFENDKLQSNSSPVTKLTVNKTPKKKTSSTPGTSIRNSLNVNEASNIIRNGTINITYEKDETNSTFEINKLPESKSIQTSNSADSKQIDTQVKSDTTFEKENTKLNSTFDKAIEESKSSIMTSDSSITNDKSILRISITSDESETGNIMNISPVIVESSFNESQISLKSPNITNNEPVQSPPSNCVLDKITLSTPLQREGTFTKESPTDLTSPKNLSTSPGRTPFPSSKRSSCKKAVLNVTRSIEKSSKASIAELPHATRVMFCSPINTPVITNQIKGKVIKSSMKGSNKSFVFNVQEPHRVGSVRKRSYTQSGSDDLDTKRQRLCEGSSNRVPCSRTSSASGKIQNTPTKLTPSKSKTETSRVARKKLPNFAALHQKQFEKMESLDECQERKARRAQMLAAGVSTATKDRDAKAETKHTLLSINPGYTRFGFKMNSDVNPFPNDTPNVTKDAKLSLNTTNSTSSKTLVKPKDPPNGLKRHAKLPSLNGSTARKEIAKQTIMREKSFAEKRIASRNESRTIIKGVRTNRRFELQMQMRNLN